MNAGAQRIMERLAALARISDEPGQLTRTYGSPAMRRANDLVAGWMRDAGMTVREDVIGNLIGRYEGARVDAKIISSARISTRCGTPEPSMVHSV